MGSQIHPASHSHLITPPRTAISTPPVDIKGLRLLGNEKTQICNTWIKQSLKWSISLATKHFNQNISASRSTLGHLTSINQNFYHGWERRDTKDRDARHDMARSTEPFFVVCPGRCPKKISPGFEAIGDTRCRLHVFVSSFFLQWTPDLWGASACGATLYRWNQSLWLNPMLGRNHLCLSESVRAMDPCYSHSPVTIRLATLIHRTIFLECRK